MSLDGKVAVITGGAGYIGTACARRLADEGAAVVVSDLSRSRVERVVEEVRSTGHQAMGHDGDIRDEQAVADLVATALGEFGRIDVLVNTAAALQLTQEDRDLVAMEVGFWDEVMEINVRGAMLASKHVLPAMLDQGSGSILHFTSTAAVAGDHGLIAYSTSKAALLGLTRSIATTYGRRGIRCNAIAPSGVWPESTKVGMGAERRKLMEEAPLTPRLGEADDVAYLVVYLASDKSSYVTGQTFFVDGGGLAHQPWVRPDLSGATG